MRYLENLSASARLLVRSLAWLLAVGVLAYGVKGLIEPGNEQLGLILTAVLCTGGAVLISLRPLLHAADRSAWNWIAAGASVWALGFWWSLLAPVSDGAAVSFADVLWLSFYPAVYVGVYRLVKGELLRTFRSIWLDGVVGGLTAAALAGSFLLKPLIAFEGGDWLTLAVLSAYPGGDMVLLAFVVGAFALRGWRPGPALALIGAGLTALAAADAVYLMDVAAAPARAGVLTDPLWPFALLLVGFAAWQPPNEKPLCKQRTWRIFFMPIVFTLGSGVVLLFALEHSRAGVLVLAAASILLGVVRIALTCRGMQAISDLSQQALTDELTGLGNRRHILRALTELLQSAQEEKRCLVVMLLDLDRFKEVNDTLGHVAGDALLRALGPRLLRAGPRDAVIARLGGDEFAVLLQDPASMAEPLACAKRLRAVVAEPFEYAGIRVDVDVSIGIAVFPAHGDESGALLRRADVAMYQSKHHHNGPRIYDPAFDSNSRQRLSLMSDLRAALPQKQFVLHYQPQARTEDGDLVRMEALIRWSHPQHGLLGPDKFLDFIEPLGLADAVAAYVIDHALRQCATWLRAGLNVPVAVNPWPKNLLDPTLPDTVVALLAHHQVPGSMLQLEVTEDTLLLDADRAVAVMYRIRATGVEFALDDFGTGYSSLSNLMLLPVNELKIDRSFVQAMLTTPADEVIVRSTVELAQWTGFACCLRGS
ncbi:MAG: EAL domain-containing protein [Actinomycetota bacterium]|nr:EAL domain-containing protein [Actinomycetota bacterium]